MFAAPTMVKRLTDDPPIAAPPHQPQDDHLRRRTDVPRRPRAGADVFGPRLAQIYGQGETPMTITALSKADHADRTIPLARPYAERRRRSHRRRGPCRRRRSIASSRRRDRRDRCPRRRRDGRLLEPAEATAETLRGGWLHTGDVGSFDDNGYLTLRDRSKDLIISGGMNIYPREVEEACSATPALRPSRWWVSPTPNGAKRSWRSSCRRQRRSAARRRSRPHVLDRSPATSGPRTTDSSMPSRPTTTARSSNVNCASAGADNVAASRTEEEAVR